MLSERGFLLIDKDEGLSSFDVIRRLRKLTGIRRIGHCGTLDPFATGLLICGLGVYTRLNQYLEARDKSYTATVKLGESTSTGDPEGEVVQTASVPESIDVTALRQAVLALDQLPVPGHSAVKINGVRAYQMARQGIDPQIPARATNISEFRVDDWQAPYLTYTCTVSKGTYIRSLSQVLAEMLNSVGYTTSLRRISIGDVSIDDAFTLSGLETVAFRDCYIAPSKLFTHLPAIIAEESHILDLHNGKRIRWEADDAVSAMVYDSSGNIVCVAEIVEGVLIPKVNLP